MLFVIECVKYISVLKNVLLINLLLSIILDEIGFYSKCASYLTTPNILTPELAEKLYVILDNWDKENPLNTRQNKFFELFLNAKFRVDSDGIFSFCPALIDKDYDDKCCSHFQVVSDEVCKVCKREFWLKETSKSE